MTLAQIRDVITDLLIDLDDYEDNVSVAFDLLREQHVWFTCCKAWVQRSPGAWGYCHRCGAYAPLFEFELKLRSPHKPQ